MLPYPPIGVALRTLSRYAPRASQYARSGRSLHALSTHRPFPRNQPVASSLRRFQSTTSEPPSSTSGTSTSAPSSQPKPGATTNPLTDRVSSQNTPPLRREQPEYQITFTCKPCGTRSSHRLSKQGYHRGSTLITCPECRNRHIISDHLNIFGDRSLTIEDLMRERGQLVKKGTLSEDGDVEFWEDGSMTRHVKDGEEKKGREVE